MIDQGLYEASHEKTQLEFDAYVKEKNADMCFSQWINERHMRRYTVEEDKRWM